MFTKIKSITVIRFSISLSLYSFFLIFLNNCSLYSQDLILTYEQSVDMALKQNIYLKQESNLLKVTKSYEQQSKVNLMPSLNAYGQGKRTDGRQYSNEESTMVNTSIDRVNYSLQANLTLFNGMYNVYRIKQAKQEHVAQSKKLERVEQSIIFQTSQSFLQLLLDKELLSIAEKDFEVQKRLFEQVEAYVNIGTRTQEDLLAQEAQFKTSEVQVINWQNQLLIDKVDLAKILVVGPEKEFDIIAPMWNVDSLLSQSYDIDTLMVLALINRPDIEQLKAEQDAASHGIRLSKSNYWPRLSGFYNYGSFYSTDYRRYNENDGSYSDISFQDQMFGENITQTYGLSVSIPIFNKLHHHSKVVHSKINHENQMLKYQDFEQQLYLDIKREHQNFIAFKESYLAKKKRAEASQRSYNKQYELYRMGKGSIVVLNLESQRNLKAQSEKIQAEYALLFQKIILNYYVGLMN